MHNHNIDDIMDLLDWNRCNEDQNKGLSLARDIENINVFLQPANKRHHKNVWDNCAIILAEKPDEMLQPYLMQLFSWLGDLTWPGAFVIVERLKQFKHDDFYWLFYKTAICHAKAEGNLAWLDNLQLVHP